jgi:hypothetical protein
MTKQNVFTESNSQWSGISLNLDLNQVLYHKKSQFQDVLVFESKSFGNVLVLDGVIQCTERDEFAYQESIAHIPICAHPNPKKVVIYTLDDDCIAAPGGTLVSITMHAIPRLKEFIKHIVLTIAGTRHWRW